MRAGHPLYLANNFWLISHDEHTGRRRAPAAVVGFGLAGSLLGELILSNAIDVSPNGELVAIDNREPTERVAREIHHTIRAEAAQPPGLRVSHVRDWLSHLRVDASQRVADRLAGNGLVETFETKRFLRAPVTQRRVSDVNAAAAPAVHITMRVKNREPMKVSDTAFAGFALAAELDRWLFLDDVTERDRAYLLAHQRGLPWSLRCLIAETEAAIGNAILSHRT